MNVPVTDANFSHVSSAAKVISCRAAVDQKQIIAVVGRDSMRRGVGGLTNRAFIVSFPPYFEWHGATLYAMNGRTKFGFFL